MRVKFLQDYQTKSTRFCFNSALCVYGFVVLAQTSVTTYLNSAYHHGYAANFTGVMNITVFVSVITFYSLSINKLRTHRQNNQQISDSTKNISKISCGYLILFILSGGYLLLIQLLNIGSVLRKLNKDLDWFVKISSFTFPTLSGIIDGFLFLIINRKAKIFIKRLLNHQIDTAWSRVTSCQLVRTRSWSIWKDIKFYHSNAFMVSSFS